MPLKTALFLSVLLTCAPALQAYDTIKLLAPVVHDDFDSPVAAAVSGKRLYILDEKRHSLFLFEDGRFIKEVGRKGDGNREFRSPQGISIGSDGRIYVADTGNARIQILDKDGKFLSRFGEKGGGAGRLRGPESVVAGTDGRVFVADTGNNRIQVFTVEGILLFSFGERGVEEGQFAGPTRVQLDPSENIYVWDSGNDRIQKFSPLGRYVKKFDIKGDDFVVDDYGFFYVLDTKRGKVSEVNSAGGIMGRFGSSGKGPGQHRKPQSLALGADGTVYVVDTGNERVIPVRLTNDDKIKILPANPETKMLVSGPSEEWPLKASLIETFGDKTYAFAPEDNQFVVLNRKGKEIRRFGDSGKGEKQFRNPKGLAVSRKLGLYVSDFTNSRIQRYGLKGAWKSNFAEKEGLFDSRKKEGRVLEPMGIDINDKGTIYVADSGNSRIDAFSPEGVFLFAIGPTLGKYELEDPVDVIWDPSGSLFFLDKGLKKVFQCEPSGAIIRTFGEEGSGPGQFEAPSAMTTDGRGYLYILDENLKRVSVYTMDGLWLTDMFSEGDGAMELSEPSDLAVQGSILRIADRGRERIAGFRLKPLLGAPLAVSSSTKGGVVAVTWKAVKNRWLKSYVVEKAIDPEGPWTEAGRVTKPRFEDSDVVVYETYHYRVASEAKTGDVGVPGKPVAVFVPGSFNRSPVEIASATIGNIFPSNYKWYLKNPVGEALIVNNTNLPFRNLKLTFRFKEFMDFGFDKKIELLKPQEKILIPLVATFNNKILEVTEDTPVQAELTLTYFEKGQKREVSLTQPLRVYSRNAITWEDPRRIANFITPKDPPILDYSRAVLREAKSLPEADHLNPNLVTAMHLWDALSEAGVKFFESPNNPYEKISEDPNFPIDLTQFPRETLKRKTGECDDLVTLMSSLMEASRLETALLDYPGHVALMFNTGSSDPLEIGIDEEYLINHKGSYWIPIEMTLIGKPFTQSVKRALHAYKKEQKRGRSTVIVVSEAWEDYEPATMPVSRFDAEVPSPAARLKRFKKSVKALSKARYSFLKKEYEALLKTDEGSADPRIDLGMLEQEYGKGAAARKQFEAILKADPDHAGALNNLGNVEFFAGKHEAAEEFYMKAAENDPKDAAIFMNLARNALKMKDDGKIRDFGAKAVALDGDLAPSVDILLKKAAETAAPEEVVSDEKK